MTEGGKPDGGAAASGKTASMPAADSSAWAPLAQRAFRWLWLAMLISWIGTWMQTVGAQWLLDRCAQRGSAGLVGAGGDHPPDDAARPTRRRPRRLLRSTLATDRGAVLSLCRRPSARRPHRHRPDATGPAAGLHLRARGRRSSAAPGLAGHDARTRAQEPATSGDPT